MGLENILGKVDSAVKGVKDYFMVPGRVESMTQYAVDDYLDDEIKRKLFAGKSDEQAKKVYHKIEEKIRGRLAFHGKNLERLSVKAGKGTGLLNLINDVYSFSAGIPFNDFFFYKHLLIGAKAVMELPAMYDHVKDTGDLYGAMEWLGNKAIAGLLPIIGPAIDLNSATRVIKKRAIWGGVNDFLKEEGLYQAKKPLYERIYDRVKDVAGDFSSGLVYSRA